MKFAAVLAFFFSLIAVGGVLYIVKNPPAATSAPMAKEESVYDRVMRTGTIRCGYGVWEPLFIKDPNTGEFSGIFYDYTEALGKALHLNIQWTQEVGYADFAEALKSNQIDIMCPGIWPSALRSRVADFTKPIFYNVLNAYVRADDTRFDNNLGAINNPSITYAAIDGETSAIVEEADFPKATPDRLPQLTNQSQVFLEIASHKADVTVTDSATAAAYMAANPGQIKQVLAPAPVRLFGNTLAISQGEDRLRRMLDTTTEEMLNSGVIESILKSIPAH